MTAELIYAGDELLLETPSWTPDGAALVLNGNGSLWRLTLEPEAILDQVRTSVRVSMMWLGAGRLPIVWRATP